MSFENRLITERRNLLFSPIPNVNICLNGNNIKQWLVEIEVPNSTFYDNDLFQLEFNFNDVYPLYPPKVVMKTQIFHPCVDKHGMVYLDIIKKNYNTFVTIRDIIEEIIKMLENPTVNDDFETEASISMKQSIDIFKEIALEQVAKNFNERTNI